jgi:hypothetical protein
MVSGMTKVRSCTQSTIRYIYPCPKIRTRRPTTNDWILGHHKLPIKVRGNKNMTTRNDETNKWKTSRPISRILKCIDWIMKTAGGDVVDSEGLTESYKAYCGSWGLSAIWKMHFSILATTAFATLISTAIAAPQPQATACPVAGPIPEFC